MARSKKPAIEISAKARAKVAAVAKATYSRKHTTTQVIPADVTRAKAGRWLDLISPITEWAGLKGDALRHRRDLLRVQQEAALERLADSIRDMMLGETVLHPLPPKILVPALEAASLEDPESPLIQWWAKLLVSGAAQSPIRPFLIDLMTKIGPEEAMFLESIWKKFSNEKHTAELLGLKHGRGEMGDTMATLNTLRVTDHVEAMIKDLLKEMDFTADTENFSLMENSATTLSAIADELGIGLVVKLPCWVRGNWIFCSYRSSNITNDISMDVCRALNIFEAHDQPGAIHHLHGAANYWIRILSFTSLGIEFMQATH